MAKLAPCYHMLPTRKGPAVLEKTVRDTDTCEWTDVGLAGKLHTRSTGGFIYHRSAKFIKKMKEGPKEGTDAF